MVRHALWSGLAAAGCPILDCGICTTPSLLFAVSRREEVAGGVLVTASHNPIEWNALKFVGADGFFLGPSEGADMIRRFREEEPTFVPHDQVGSVRTGPDLAEEHLGAVVGLPWIDEAGLRKQGFSVVVDCVGGAASAPAPQLLERLGCKTERLYCEPDGTFPRGAEPKPANLGDLAARVRDSGADAGFAFDPDGDRLALVGPGGEAISEEATLALVVDYLLARTPGPVVVNLSTSRMSEDLAERYGVPLYRTPVGEAHVAAALREKGAVVGGEGNGGVMVPALHPMRDGMVGMALVLQAMLEAEGGLGELMTRLPSYDMRKSTVPADTWNEDLLLEGLSGRFGEGKLDRRDGLRLEWGNRWIHVRPSNTEPLVRLIVEAPEERGAKELEQSVRDVLGGSGG